MKCWVCGACLLIGIIKTSLKPEFVGAGLEAESIGTNLRTMSVKAGLESEATGASLVLGKTHSLDMCRWS